jgi:vacuolar-type H+-ATPase subunit H
MQHKKNQMSVGLMIQRCHRWRQKRKQYIDQARQTADEIERERLLQMAEHYGRIVSDEQGKIDTTRDPRPKGSAQPESDESEDDEDSGFPDFMSQLGG